MTYAGIVHRQLSTVCRITVLLQRREDELNEMEAPKLTAKPPIVSDKTA